MESMQFLQNRPNARETKLAEFGIKKSAFKSYSENLEGKPRNPGVKEKSWVFTQNMTHQQRLWTVSTAAAARVPDSLHEPRHLRTDAVLPVRYRIRSIKNVGTAWQFQGDFCTYYYWIFSQACNLDATDLQLIKLYFRLWVCTTVIS
jgi:hypothetical protein